VSGGNDELLRGARKGGTARPSKGFDDPVQQEPRRDTPTEDVFYQPIEQPRPVWDYDENVLLDRAGWE
jgi:hypothetical protein